MGRPARWLLPVVLAGLGCTGHRPPDVHACPDSALLEQVEGRWKVGYAIYRDGQKPPDQRPIGELVIEDCEFRFVANDAALYGEHRRERLAAADEMPFIEAQGGRIEVLGELGDDPSQPEREQGQLRFTMVNSEGQLGEVWDVSIMGADGRYFYMRPQQPERFHGSIHRGHRMYRVVPSSDSDE